MGLKTSIACALILCGLVAPASAAGIQLLESDPALQGGIWYPCASEPKVLALGKLSVPAEFGLKGAKDCPIAGTGLPLVVFSHGRGAWFGAHHDTAEALADAGFVVAAINHPGDNANDSSQRDKISVWAARPVDMIHLVDFMLHDWKDKVAIDPARVGFFGFSLGAFTGLVLVGGNVDFRRLTIVCKEDDRTENCERAQRRCAAESAPRSAHQGCPARRHRIELGFQPCSFERHPDSAADLALGVRRQRR
ncbi:alpha/beta hydrolase family protein [Bradyrhizobium sp. UFLA05-112]